VIAASSSWMIVIRLGAWGYGCAGLVGHCDPPVVLGVVTATAVMGLHN